MKDRDHPFFLVKIGDLGVAKLLDTSTAFAQTIVGTPYYLSPELCADQPYRDKSDCWALGVLLYEVSLCHLVCLSDCLSVLTFSVTSMILYRVPLSRHQTHTITCWHLPLHLTNTTVLHSETPFRSSQPVRPHHEDHTDTCQIPCI